MHQRRTLRPSGQEFAPSARWAPSGSTPEMPQSPMPRGPLQTGQRSGCACGGGCPRCQTAELPRLVDAADVFSPRAGETRTTTIPFSAHIRAANPTGESGTSTAATAGAGKSVHDDPAAAPAEEAAQATPAPSREDTPTPPDILDDGTLYIEQMGGLPAWKDTGGAADAVAATFSYTTATTRGGVTLGASEFGQTTGSLKHFSNVSITPDAGKFTVTADLKQTVSWDTRATVGPNNQVNIASTTDPALTNTNYAQVVSDLTPDASDLKGRPPRTGFWSKDLTEQHEKYHVKDFVDIGKTSAASAETWLAGKSAARKEDVPALLDTAWSDKIFKVWDAFTDPPAVEERAYSDGSASYKARADAIKAKGDKGPTGGGYP